ncbi:class I SAM-dependent methyltransferase [Rhodobaculum claviforme]|uniref:MFS transporter n=1 Tax=Rhodobaculum claviforme TaxID=1549854 RepID=A0A934TMM1_9RHOB|nr:methyltransferase [Rhodobaculum claviforme]MBK5927813.1 MFS transporter [Rhodobaculum claviforme]
MSVPDPRAARLSLALETPPSGRTAAFGPRAGADLSALGPAVEVITGFRPDHDAFAARGLVVRTAPEGRYALSLVCLPRARAAAQDLVAQALACTDGKVLVDGQKTDGIDAILRAARTRAGTGDPVIKAHGKLFALDGAAHAAFADWHAGPRRLADGFVTRPGVFSADGPDPGSRLLAGALPARLPGRVADLGAGWGWLGAQVLTRDGVSGLDLVEADLAAVACARDNLDDARVRVHWADATAFQPDAPFDTVVMNPPFHPGRAGDPALGTAFIAAAARMLAPHGSLWMVANRHLPYEAALAATFREVTEHPGTPAYKLFHARSPRRAGGRRPA